MKIVKLPKTLIEKLDDTDLEKISESLSHAGIKIVKQLGDEFVSQMVLSVADNPDLNDQDAKKILQNISGMNSALKYLLNAKIMSKAELKKRALTDDKKK